MVEQQIIDLVFHYGYLIIFPIALVEGPIISILVGFVLSLGYLNFLPVFIALLMGDILGDLFYYFVGRYGANYIFSKWGRFFFITKERLEKAVIFIKDNKIKYIYFGKFVQCFGMPLLMAVGMSKVPLLNFLKFSIPAAIVKTLGLVLIGYFFGGIYNVLEKYLGISSAFLFLIIVVAISIFIFIKKRKKLPGGLGDSI